MKTKLLFLLLFVNLINAQTRYLEVKIKDKESNDDIKSATIIEDSINSSLFTFLEEEKVTYGFKYNHHRLLESKITSEGLKRKYKSIIGSIVNNNQKNQFSFSVCLHTCSIRIANMKSTLPFNPRTEPTADST